MLGGGETVANPADSENVPPSFFFSLSSELFCYFRLEIFEADARDGRDLAPGHKWPCAINYVNLAERRLRSFSSLTNTTDLDPVKQKKADVIGLRKSSRGVKPHLPTHPNPPLIQPSSPREAATLVTAGAWSL